MVEPPIWKICIKLNQFPYFRDGKNKKSLSCHRPVVFLDRHQRAHLIWSAVQSNLGLELIFSLSLRPLCELRFLLWTMGFFSSSLFDVVWNWKDAGSVRIECVCERLIDLIYLRSLMVFVYWAVFLLCLHFCLAWKRLQWFDSEPRCGDCSHVIAKRQGSTMRTLILFRFVIYVISLYYRIINMLCKYKYIQIWLKYVN